MVKNKFDFWFNLGMFFVCIGLSFYLFISHEESFWFWIAGCGSGYYLGNLESYFLEWIARRKDKEVSE